MRSEVDLIDVVESDILVKSILVEFESIQKVKFKNTFQVENIVRTISFELRHAPKNDHMLHSTALWVLIQICRSNPLTMRPLMLGAGMPSLIVDIIKANVLTGTTRHYASELCSFLW